jgi:hypothetical protein
MTQQPKSNKITDSGKPSTEQGQGQEPKNKMFNDASHAPTSFETLQGKRLTETDGRDLARADLQTCVCLRRRPCFSSCRFLRRSCSPRSLATCSFQSLTGYWPSSMYSFFSSAVNSRAVARRARTSSDWRLEIPKPDGALFVTGN